VNGSLPLRVVDADTLSAEHRALLMPGQPVPIANRQQAARPRYFYEVESRETARQLELAPHFALWEFLDVDVREAPLLRTFPRYIPCAVGVLAVHLELFRLQVGVPIRIAANGGYRSPSAEGADPRSPHTWGTAVNIHRIGDEAMDNRETVERYAAIARRVLPAVWCRPYGVEPGKTTDHLHLDLGYTSYAPRG
jgi:hypothetical protein